MRRGHNNKNSIIIDEDDRTFSRPNRDLEPDRTFNREPERVPYSKQAVLLFDQREGYVRYLCNELPGEIERMQRAGWSIVTKGSTNIADDSDRATQMDSVVRLVVNQDPKAPVRTGVLMEKPIEWYEADAKEDQRLIDEQEEEFNPEKFKQKGFNGLDYGFMRREKKTF